MQRVISDLQTLLRPRNINGAVYSAMTAGLLGLGAAYIWATPDLVTKILANANTPDAIVLWRSIGAALLVLPAWGVTLKVKTLPVVTSGGPGGPRSSSSRRTTSNTTQSLWPSFTSRSPIHVQMASGRCALTSTANATTVQSFPLILKQVYCILHCCRMPVDLSTKMFCPWTARESSMLKAPADHGDSLQQQLLKLGVMLMGLGYLANLLPLQNTAQA